MRKEESTVREEKTPAELRRDRKRNKKRKWILRIILILFFCVLILVLWFNRNHLIPENFTEWVRFKIADMGRGDGYPYAIQGDTVLLSNFFSDEKEAIVVSDKSLNVLNSSAKAVLSRQHNYSSPAVKVSGTRYLIYGVGSTAYQVETVSQTAVKKNTEDKILAGAVSENGRYLLATQADNYTAELTAYLSDGTKQFRYRFANCYVTDVALNGDGTKGVACGIFAENGGLCSAVYLFDFSSPEPVKIFTYQNNMMLAAYYENDSIFCVGDALTTVIGASSMEEKIYSYDSAKLRTWDFDSERVLLALAQYEGSPDTDLVLLGNTGEIRTKMTVSDSVTAVSLYKNTEAVLCGEKVIAYSASDGKEKASCETGSGARDIALRDESSLYILAASEIRYQVLKEY